MPSISSFGFTQFNTLPSPLDEQDDNPSQTFIDDLIPGAKLSEINANKITTGNMRVTDYIQSKDFVTLTSGWRINGDGTAEFQTVIAGKYVKVFRQDAIPTSEHIGDLWVKTDSGNKLYVALSIGADQIAAGEWVDASDEAIATAQAAAEAAQSDADDAQGELDDIADDEKITPVEKLTIKPLWDAIVAEKSDIDAQANIYSVSKTAYGTAYDNLNTYLNTTLDSPNGVFNNMTATTSITRADWDGFWEAYYNAKIEILQAIANATSSYTVIVDVNGGGDYTEIQPAINYVNSLGGGAIFIKSGTYTLTDDLTLYSDILLEGSKASECILNFNDNSKKIQATGLTNSYTTGVISINSGSKIITGGGTSWVGNITPGEQIFLTDAFYEVLTVDSDTQITLRYTYYGTDITTSSYIFYTYKKNIIIKSLWIQKGGVVGGGATPEDGDGAIKLSRTQDSYIDDVIIDNSLSTGIELEHCDRVHIAAADSSHNDYRGFYGDYIKDCSILHSKFNNNGFNGVDLDSNSDYNTIFDIIANHNYGDGIVFYGSRNIVLGNRAIKNRYNDGAGSGINVYGSLNRITENECSDNFVHGIKAEGETNIIKNNICEVNGYGGFGSGIYIYGDFGDKNIISGNGCYVNQQYGVDISAATCDKNSVLNNQLVSNTTDAIHDLGTDTEIGHNMV